jgi:Tsi6
VSGDDALWDLVERGLRMTDERILLSPGFDLYHSIRAQLAFIQGHLIDRSPIAEEDRQRLILGVLAAREFETSDPDYADVLFDVSYRVNRWSPT